MTRILEVLLWGVLFDGARCAIGLTSPIAQVSAAIGLVWIPVMLLGATARTARDNGTQATTLCSFCLIDSPTSSRWHQRIDLNVASAAGIKYESPMRTGTHRRMSVAGDSVRWKYHSTPCSRRYTDPKMLDSVIIVKTGMGRRGPCSEHRISCFLRRGLSMGFPK